MARPQHYFDWQQIVERESGEPVTTSGGRLRWLLVFFCVLLAAIFFRAVQLELSDGPSFRQLAVEPRQRTVSLPQMRGRILARDGTVLAGERKLQALTVQFQYLENPPNPKWLRGLARARLPRAERRKNDRVAAMEAEVRDELAEMHRRLARWCDLSDVQWQFRAARIQRRVNALADHVNQRRLDQFKAEADAETNSGEWGLMAIVAGLFTPPEQLAPSPLVIAEQVGFHRIVDDVPPALVAELEKNAKNYPGVKIVEITRRDYPLGPAAAHFVGYVGSDAMGQGSAPVGLTGVEGRAESTLRGVPGCEVQYTDHGGKLLSTVRQREPVAGGDVVLTIDAQLQLSAEQALDHALRRRDKQAGAEPAPGGAIVVMDVHSGEILATASGPRFDPNLFAAGDPRVEAILTDPRQPLFDRVAKMALAPGSVFKSVTALALVESKVIDPQAAFRCQGYLADPDRLRCQIFRQHGIGHGDVTLADALAQSCNVYFFHHATELGAARLLDWSSRFGFGQPTGIEVVDEVAGHLPTSAQLRQLSQTQMFAVGQGPFTATPLEIVRVYAAIANGGYLITPRVTIDAPVDRAERRGTSETPPPMSEAAPIAGLTPASLDAVRAGLRRVVDDPNGTGYATVRLPSLAIAGKTGTAETGGNQPDHAWFAGYAPADAPRYAFVVVLEHAGSGATAAGTVAKSLVQRMQQLNYFGQEETAERAIPPGKG